MPIEINNKELRLMKAHVSANYKSKTVLSNSAFDYVDLWLKSQPGDKYREAGFYWRQAKYFYDASQLLPIEAKPLTSYYSCMNAAKALLVTKGINVNKISHGVASSRLNTSGDIANDHITYTGSGVLNNLSRIYGEDVNKVQYCVKDLLYNVPCIHRTFTITNKAYSELFIPISNVVFDVTNDRHHKAYVKFKVDPAYANGYVYRFIPNCFEKTFTGGDDTFFRYKKRFKWDIHETLTNRLQLLQQYHNKVRPNFHYIVGNEMLWYIKKNLPANQHIINRSSPTLIYGVMHWLSELVRYSPACFNNLMSGRQNWLIREFLDIGLPQYIDELSSDITGSNIMSTGYRKD